MQFLTAQMMMVIAHLVIVIAHLRCLGYCALEMTRANDHSTSEVIVHVQGCIAQIIKVGFGASYIKTYRGIAMSGRRFRAK